MLDACETAEIPSELATFSAVALSVSFWYQTTLDEGSVPEGLPATTLLYPAWVSTVFLRAA
jgi:hypothetical protein